jgi:hypothetical protein
MSPPLFQFFPEEEGEEEGEGEGEEEGEGEGEGEGGKLSRWSLKKSFFYILCTGKKM